MGLGPNPNPKPLCRTSYSWRRVVGDFELSVHAIDFSTVHVGMIDDV